MTVEAVLAIQSAALIGAAVVLGLLLRATKALQQTVKAQAEQLNGMKTLSETMKTVLESTDERRMLERLQAYKAFADEEVKTLEARLETERKTHRADAGNAILALTHGMSRMARVAIGLMPFAPPMTRAKMIDDFRTPISTDPAVRELEVIVLDAWHDGLTTIAASSPVITALDRLSLERPK